MWTTTWGGEAGECVDDDYWHGIKTGQEKVDEGGRVREGGKVGAKGIYAWWCWGGSIRVDVMVW